MRLTSDHKLLLPQEEVAIKKETATAPVESSKGRESKGCTNYKTTSPETLTRAGHANNKV